MADIIAPASISGTVYKEDGTTPLAKATVSVKESTTSPDGIFIQATTDKFGKYYLGPVEEDRDYTVRVSSSYYRFQPLELNINGHLTGYDFVGQE
jgi:hypothetical protein